MSNLQALEKAVTNLSKNELILFRLWFEEYESKLWDNQIENDISSGKFDNIAKIAIDEYKSGNVTLL